MSENIALPKNIFNLEKQDYNTPKILLGESAGLMDTINNHFPDLYSIYKRLRKLDWDELEFDFSSCLTDFNTCDKSTYDMMLKTLIWQWEADSIAARQFIGIISAFVTDSRVWAGELRVAENECLIEGTECLTPRGWVDLADLKDDDLVMQYDSDTKGMNFVKPTDRIEKDFDGNLIQFKNHYGHIWQIVTPGHRMIRESLETGEVEINTADNFMHGRGAASYRWSAPSTGSVAIGSDKTGYLSPIERALIAIQADGSVSKRYTGEIVGVVPVTFSFYRKRKIKRIKSLARLTGWELREYDWNTFGSSGNKQANFKLMVPVEYKDLIGDLSWVTLENKNRYWCREFLEEVIEWDGCWTKNTGIFDSVNEEDVKTVQAIASMAGYRTHFRLAGEPLKDTHNQLYRVTWKDQPYVNGQVIEKTLVPYKGKVRCVTVHTGLFLIRYNGAVSVTGNCVHAMTYSEIVRNSFTNPNEIMEEVFRVEEAHSRMKVVSEVLSEASIAADEYKLGTRENDQSLHDIAFLFYCAVYMFERIQFMASFAVTFGICKTGLFQPIGHAVKKIAQDEFEIHAQYRQGIIKHTLALDEGKKSYENVKPRIVELFIEVIKSEIEWVDYLFSEGRSLTGVNAKKLFDWVLFNAHAVKVFLGITDEELTDYAKEFKEFTGDDLVFPTVNPLPYMEEYMDISASQGSPQEEKSKSDYQVNLLDSRDEEATFDVDF